MKHNLRQYTPLIALLAMTLFPVGWLTHRSGLAQRLGNFLFPNEAAHAVGHTLLFMAVGAVLLVTFPALRRWPIPYFSLVFAIALGQEAFQLLYKRRGVVLNDITDIAIDLVAAGLVWGLWYIVTSFHTVNARSESGDGVTGYAQTPGRRR